ncbi:MAG: hypothetical protein RMJ97_02010, partial [Raineya sp.]|nr:hypothetical protein [Raineya sp.]
MNRYYLLFAILFLLNLEVKGQEYRYQRGYYKPSTGTYVQPHMKTYNNETNHDNFSTKYNTNPFTNQKGYRARDYSYESYNYGAGQ